MARLAEETAAERAARKGVEEAGKLVKLVPLSERITAFLKEKAKPVLAFITDTRLKNWALAEIEKAYKAKAGELETDLQRQDELGQTRLAKAIERIWNLLRQERDDAVARVDKIYGGKESLRSKEVAYRALVEEFGRKARELGRGESELA
ncbi:MAG: hypothetical protein QXH27_03055 [Candidatus Micrarchaeia archaeon]